MRKILFLTLALFILGVQSIKAQDAWDGTSIATSFAGGNGTASSPYLISTAAQFMYFVQTANDGETYEGKYLKLTENISLEEKVFLQRITSFAGNFDGGNHYIYKYNCTLDSYGGANLFGSVTGTIHNLGLYVWDNIRSYCNVPCALATSLNEGGLIYSCYVNLQFVGCESYGMAGIVKTNNGDVVNCEVEGTMYTTTSYGNYKSCAGICVYNEATGRVLHCDISNLTISYGVGNVMVAKNNGIIDYGTVLTGYDYGTITNDDTYWDAWKSAHPLADLTLPNTLKEIYTIKFNDSYGLVSYPSINVAGGSAIGSQLPTPDVDDCIFDKWTCVGKTVTSETIVATDMTLNASWIQKIITEPTVQIPTVVVSDPNHAQYTWYKIDKDVTTYSDWQSTNTANGSTSTKTYNLSVKSGDKLSFAYMVS